MTCWLGLFFFDSIHAAVYAKRALERSRLICWRYNPKHAFGNHKGTGTEVNLYFNKKIFKILLCEILKRLWFVLLLSFDYCCNCSIMAEIILTIFIQFYCPILLNKVMQTIWFNKFYVTMTACLFSPTLICQISNVYMLPSMCHPSALISHAV